MTEVVTGEAVILEVPCARFPSRLLALVIDLVIQFVLFAVLLSIIGVAALNDSLNAASVGAIAVAVIVTVVVGYPVIWETLTRGRSPGKFALGLRVVSDDGGPERFRQALVRGLAAAVEIWMFMGCPALICSLLSARGKRLGDLFGGTFVIQQRLPGRRSMGAPLMMTPELAHWAAGLEMSGLSEQTAATASRYLARVPELTPAAQAELGERIAAAVRAQVSPPPPPGTPAPAYLGAVLAERHNREHARLTGPPTTAVPGYGQPPPGPSATEATRPVPVSSVPGGQMPPASVRADAVRADAVRADAGPADTVRADAVSPDAVSPGAGSPGAGPARTARAGEPEAGGEEPRGEPRAPETGGFVPPT